MLLALPPVRGTFWSGLVGVASGRFFLDGDRMRSLSARVRLRLEGETWMPGEPVDAAPALFVDTVPIHADALPVKGWVDVLVDGESFVASRDRPLVVGAGDKRVTVERGTPLPGLPPLEDEQSFFLARDVDGFHEAPLAHRVPALDAGATLSWDIDGTVAAHGVLAFALEARADYLDGARTPIAMTVDTIRISAVKRTAEIVFRGLLAEPSGGATPERIILAVVPPGLADDAASALLDAGLARSSFALAASTADCMSSTRPRLLTEDELTVARMSAWDAGPGEPSLTPEEYNEIVSALARRPRAEVLGEFGFDEISWGREEWAVGEKVAAYSVALAEYADDGGADETGDSGGIEPKLDPEAERWVAALKPKVDVPLPDLDAYARLTAHMMVRDPSKVLADAKLTLGEFIAIEQSMSEQLENHPESSEQLEGLLERYREEAAKAAEQDFPDLAEDG